MQKVHFCLTSRFSDFIALRDKLLEEEPDHVIPMCLEKGNLKEKVYKSDELQLAYFTDTRSEHIRYFLQKILNNEQLRESDAFKEFYGRS